MERRLDRLEARLGGGGEDCGQLAIIAPNSWADADRASWERAQILQDDDVEDALIARYSGQQVRPCRCARQHINVIEVPAPAEIEQASEAARAIWRARSRTSSWRDDGQAS
jgi:hypothetical protein